MRWVPLFALGCAGPLANRDQEAETPTPVEVVRESDTEVRTDIELPTDPCLAQPTSVELGTGELTFEPLADRADVFLRTTPSGGPSWYVPLSIRVRNSTETVVVTQQMFLADGIAISPLSTSANLLAPEQGLGEPWACSGDLLGLGRILDPARYNGSDGGIAPWDELCGVEVRVHTEVFRVLSGLGDLDLLASDEHSIRLQPDPCDCSACGVDTPTCSREGTEACHGTPFLPTCERPEGYCDW